MKITIHINITSDEFLALLSGKPRSSRLSAALEKLSSMYPSMTDEGRRKYAADFERDAGVIFGKSTGVCRPPVPEDPDFPDV